MHSDSFASAPSSCPSPSHDRDYAHSHLHLREHAAGPSPSVHLPAGHRHRRCRCRHRCWNRHSSSHLMIHRWAWGRGKYNILSSGKLAWTSFSKHRCCRWCASWYQLNGKSSPTFAALSSQPFIVNDIRRPLNSLLRLSCRIRATQTQDRLSYY